MTKKWMTFLGVVTYSICSAQVVSPPGKEIVEASVAVAIVENVITSDKSEEYHTLKVEIKYYANKKKHKHKKNSHKQEVNI